MICAIKLHNFFFCVPLNSIRNEFAHFIGSTYKSGVLLFPPPPPLSDDCFTPNFFQSHLVHFISFVLKHSRFIAICHLYVLLSQVSFGVLTFCHRSFIRCANISKWWMCSAHLHWICNFGFIWPLFSLFWFFCNHSIILHKRVYFPIFVILPQLHVKMQKMLAAKSKPPAQFWRQSISTRENPKRAVVIIKCLCGL